MSPPTWKSLLDTRDSVLAAAGALGALFGVTALALVASESGALTRAGNPTRPIHYAVAVAAIGAGSALAWRRDLRAAVLVTAVLVVAGTYARAPNGTSPVTSLAAGLTGLTVVGTGLAAVEYAARNTGRAKRALTTRAVKRAAVLGAAHTVFVFALHDSLGFSTAYFYTAANTAFTVWSAVGAFALGTAVAWCWFRHRLVLPAVTTVSIFAWSLVETLPYAPRFSEVGYAAVGLTPLSLYRWGWFAVLAAAAVAAGIESVARKRLSA